MRRTVCASSLWLRTAAHKQRGRRCETFRLLHPNLYLQQALSTYRNRK